MKVLTWAIRLTIFLFLFTFAAMNTEPVTLRFILGQAWQAPMVIILLLFFAVGAMLGVLSLLGLLFRQRREIGRLRRELDKPAAPAVMEPPPAA